MMPPTTHPLANLAPDQRRSTTSHASLRLQATIRQAKAPVQLLYISHPPRSALPQTFPAAQRPPLPPCQARTNLAAAQPNPHSPSLRRR